MVPVESGFVEVQGGRLYFERSGAGPPLVWIHAAIGDHRMWDHEFIQYARQYTVIRYDVRGLGRSTAATAPYSDTDDLLAVLDRLGIQRAILIGCSNGGRIAIDLAITHPERVDRLVLVAPGLGGFAPSSAPEEHAVFQRAAERFGPMLAAYRSGERSAAIAELLRFWCSAQKGPSLDLVIEMLRDNLEEVFTDASASYSKDLDPPAAGRLASISAPTLLLLGDRDAEQIRFIADRVASGIPGTVRKTIPGADHLINLSRPREFDEAVREFLARPA
jgi:pimeloyl-ACP methyl ester carboxylesterase